MQTTSIDTLELFEGWFEGNADTHVRAAFPISCGTGAKSSTVVYFELDPGQHLASHTDSAEETLLILSGTGEATIGDEQGPVQTGTLAVVPALVPHGVANTGKETLRVVGFFSSNTVLSVFDEPMQPFGTRIFVTPMVEEGSQVTSDA